MNQDTRTAENTAESAAESPDADDRYQHIVGWWEWLKTDVLRLRIPRALCGQVLEGDPDQPQVTPETPFCPTCVARNGRMSVRWIPGSWR